MESTLGSVTLRHLVTVSTHAGHLLVQGIQQSKSKTPYSSLVEGNCSYVFGCGAVTLTPYCSQAPLWSLE